MGDGKGKGRGKGKYRHPPSVDMVAPPLAELFGDRSLLELVEAPSAGEAVAPSPMEPAAAPA
eukprot:14178262-Alexandrium_andersonii.AAC.1